MVSRNSSSKFLLFLSLLLVSSLAFGQSALEQVEKEVQRLFDQAKESVGQIKAIQQDPLQPLAAGTGFFIDDKGLILTSSEVVKGAAHNDILVIWSGKQYEARRVGFDIGTNLALVQIEAAGTPALKFGNSDTIRQGTMVVGVGYPLNSPVAPEMGNVSDDRVLWQRVQSGSTPQKTFAIPHIRASVRVAAGQAGSPLLNSKGEVVGMIVAAEKDGAHSFAIPTWAIQKIQPDLQQHHQPQYGFVGIAIREEALNAKGEPDPRVYVENVHPGTSAQMSGIKKGDQLVAINGQKIQDAEDVMKATFYLRVNDRIVIRVRSDKGQETDHQIQIGPRPVTPARVPLGEGIPASQVVPASLRQ
jgi:serine protease Do